MSLHTFLFTTLAEDPVVNSFGISADNVFAAQALDSFEPNAWPAPDTFFVLRYTGSSPGLSAVRGSGRPRQSTCQLWGYDKQRDYERTINPVLKRWEEMIDSLEGPAMGDNAFLLGADYVGRGDEVWDDVYDRITTYSAYTITYTGP